jgi:hypothetical protein
VAREVAEGLRFEQRALTMRASVCILARLFSN